MKNSFEVNKKYDLKVNQICLIANLHQVRLSIGLEHYTISFLCRMASVIPIDL